MKFGYVLPDLSTGICGEWSEIPKECVLVGDCRSGMHEGDYWVLTDRTFPIWMRDTSPSVHPKLQAFHDDPTVKVGVFVSDEDFERAKVLGRQVQKELTGCGGCG